VQPDYVHVLAGGRIVKSGRSLNSRRTRSGGYEWLRSRREHAAGRLQPGFRAFANCFPEAERAQRRVQLDRFLASGFRVAHVEVLRYTDLSEYADRDYMSAVGASVAPSNELLADVERLVYVNGRVDCRVQYGAAVARGNRNRCPQPAKALPR